MENKDKKVLLKVEHLSQHFKFGKHVLRAVDDVNFEIYKGEVFGLVGESGCGKTTTGRTIIRLYDATGGSVYFEDKRIVAGVFEYKNAIKMARMKYKMTVDALNNELKETPEDSKETKQIEVNDKIAELKAEYEKVRAENIDKIRAAKFDHRNCNKEFAKFEMKKVDEKYQPLIDAKQQEVASAKESGASDLETKEAELQELQAKYKEEKRIASKDRIMNKIQMIFQDPIASLDPRMTVRDIIAEGLIIRGIRDKKYIDEQVYRVLELVGLVQEHATRYPHEFSGGQRQRIGIARAIILNPDLIIADEPISALDVSIQAQVINLLNELRESMGLTIMFIAHDLSVVKYFSDRIAVMYFGHIVELSTSDELFKHPLHPYTKSLLSAIPLPDPRYEKKRKRITYNPLSAHDYSKEGPTMREILPGHFILCNSEEFAKYQEEIKNIDKNKQERLVMKKTILEYSISTGICALLAFLIMVIGGIFVYEEQFRIYALICDGCFISGIIFVCLGLLFFVYNNGFFDILAYGFMRFFAMFKKNPREVKYETFYDYRVAKAERPKADFMYLIIVGVVFIAVSIIFLILWDQAGGNITYSE